MAQEARRPGVSQMTPEQIVSYVKRLEITGDDDKKLELRQKLAIVIAVGVPAALGAVQFLKAISELG